MARKSSMGALGGFLLFLGSLLYLYVGFTWYSSGTLGPWLSLAQFFGPFVAAFALISAIVLFFMSLAGLMGKTGAGDKMKTDILWKFIVWGGALFFILTAGGAWFYWVVLAFVLTYLGAASQSM